MPNHFHAILFLSKDINPLAHQIVHKPLGRLIAAFKTVSTRRINGIRGTHGQRVWHRNYYEHVIRNDGSLDRIREYIVTNPARWALDRENPTLSASTTPAMNTEAWMV